MNREQAEHILDAYFLIRNTSNMKDTADYWQVICYHADGCIMRESDLDNCYWENVQTLARQWNTRHERTCECVAEYAKSPIDGKKIVLHRCSACHELMRPTMPYCPNCGAKVVSE